MGRFPRLAGVFVLLALAAFNAVVRAAPTTADPLVGDWLYWRNHPVTFNADGTADWPGKGGFHGTWEFLRNPEVQRHYRIVWDQGKSVDNLTLAEDRQRAHVINQQTPSAQYDVRRTIPARTASATATTTPAATTDSRDPLVGNWVWNVGRPAVFRADGTALQNNNLNGVWEYLPGPGPNRNYRVNWEHGRFIETFVCAPDVQSAVAVKAGYPPFDVHRAAPDGPAASPAATVAAATDLPAAVPPEPGDPLVGNWRWKGGNVTVFRADGTATENRTLQGVWQYLRNPDPERRYRVVWQHGFEETFTCSVDGRSAQGVNKTGTPFDARRISSPDAPPVSSQPFGTAAQP